MRPPDDFLTGWEDNGSSYTVDPADEPRIDAAVSAYVESGCTRDRVLHLTFTDGREYSVRASVITSWARSTPETRRRALELQKFAEDEDQQLRQELGIWEAP